MFKFKTIYGKFQAVLVITGIVFSILFIVLIVYKSRLEKQVIKSSNQQYSDEINSLFKLNSEYMVKTVNFYTFWDEFVTAIDNGDKEWIKENITIISFYKFNYICIYNKKFEIVEKFSENQIEPELIITEQALDALHTKRFLHYFVTGPEGLMEVSAASVHHNIDPAHNLTEPEGYMVVARKFDENMLRDLSKISGARIAVLSPTDSIHDNDKKSVYAKLYLPGWDGNNIAVILFNRDLNLNFTATKNIMYIILAFVVFALILADIISRRYINRPLKLVTNILKTDNHKSIEELKNIPAEYGNIGSLFEDYVKQKEELSKAKEKAEESDRLKSAFLANMSHEIRTPMNAIIGFSDLIEFETDPVKRSHYVKVIQNSSSNLLNLIVDIVDLSKIEIGAMQMTYSDFLVSDIFNELKEIYEVELKKNDKNNIKLSCSLSENISINSDPHRIKQILSNLLGNAVKFTSKGEIQFGCKRIKNELIFSVTDTGTGIPEADQKKIFERFIKFDYEGLNHDGTGIGLSLVEKLTTLLNGKVWVKSESGKGSSFFFSIPYIPATSKTIPTSILKTSNSIEVQEIRKKLLVVEDDKNSFFLIQEILSPLNLDIHHIDDGSEAVEYIRQNPDTHLVLMDMKLPKMNGDEAVIAIRKFNTEIIIVAQTAFAMLGDREKALNAGCNDYITKPLESKKLLELVNRLLT